MPQRQAAAGQRMLCEGENLPITRQVVPPDARPGQSPFFFRLVTCDHSQLACVCARACASGSRLQKTPVSNSVMPHLLPEATWSSSLSTRKGHFLDWPSQEVWASPDVSRGARALPCPQPVPLSLWALFPTLPILCSPQMSFTISPASPSGVHMATHYPDHLPFPPNPHPSFFCHPLGSATGHEWRDGIWRTSASQSGLYAHQQHGLRQHISIHCLKEWMKPEGRCEGQRRPSTCLVHGSHLITNCLSGKGGGVPQSRKSDASRDHLANFLFWIVHTSNNVPGGCPRT